MADMKTGSLKRSFWLIGSILSIAAKRKTQIGGRALHILRDGIASPPQEEE
ncbi:hypothetical protein V1290_006222 [Bradyrhizobium sp. AZCC 1578]|uniref:hypothetical protein n=1 Tax=unclassified Bradyrhizobium TaxID=2631580 RepID=UPI002FF033A9